MSTVLAQNLSVDLTGQTASPSDESPAETCPPSLPSTSTVSTKDTTQLLPFDSVQDDAGSNQASSFPFTSSTSSFTLASASTSASTPSASDCTPRLTFFYHDKGPFQQIHHEGTTCNQPSSTHSSIVENKQNPYCHPLQPALRNRQDLGMTDHDLPLQSFPPRKIMGDANARAPRLQLQGSSSPSKKKSFRPTRRSVESAKKKSTSASPASSDTTISASRHRRTNTARLVSGDSSFAPRTPSSPSLSFTNPSSSSSPSSSSKVRIPLHLPTPILENLSDPYQDLAAHLHRHGMHVEAEDFKKAGVPVDYILKKFFSVAQGGSSTSLLAETTSMLGDQAEWVNKQLGERMDGSLPSSIVLEVNDGIQGLPQSPSHLLAIHSSSARAEGAGGNGESPQGMIVPAHALVYALQCVSIPPFTSTCAASCVDPQESKPAGKALRALPVIPLAVPRPSRFGITHRWLYNQDRSALLSELVPMRHIIRYRNQRSSQGRRVPGTLLNPLEASEALSTLGTSSLLTCADTIHSAWANGVAIGLISRGYWETLSKAWELIVAGIVLAKRKKSDLAKSKQMEENAKVMRSTAL
ncbi:hypothetical protein IE53DRAFT_389636 [Violaceomyces palustris]|uniref:Uncharacterized protein n=1 Tax=Violaceomyces palustris TaxID=1673888 RepID=A0ACD0NQV4_9BASI|nr:hypothetical protein IE53DRAFT_389636 [Violaceomyces palustris]